MAMLKTGSFKNDVIRLSAAFGLIFFGYNGIQQFVTIYFQSQGAEKVGFISLILVYVFLTVFTVFSGMIVSRLGARRSMLIGAAFYTAFIIALIVGGKITIYFFSALLGMAATLLWVGQGSSIIRFSAETEYGRNSGLFNLIITSGTFLGIIALGFVANFFSFSWAFALWAVFPLLGMLLISRLKDTEVERPKFSLLSSWRAVTSSTTLRISSIRFVLAYIQGITYGALPISLSQKVAPQYVGLVMSLFYIIPLVITFYIGKSSDILGRKIYIIVSYLLCFAAFILLAFWGNLAGILLAVILLGLNFAIMNPVTMALVGDIAEDKKIELVTSIIFMMHGLGTICALFVSLFLANFYLYGVSLLLAVLSFFLVLPLIKSSFKDLKSKIAEEIG